MVADGGYASQPNVAAGRAMGLKHIVFHKPVGVSLTAMGVKAKAISPSLSGPSERLKPRKGHDGFKAFVWASALSYNLVRLMRLSPD